VEWVERPHDWAPTTGMSGRTRCRQPSEPRNSYMRTTYSTRLGARLDMPRRPEREISPQKSSIVWVYSSGADRNKSPAGKIAVAEPMELPTTTTGRPATFEKANSSLDVLARAVTDVVVVARGVTVAAQRDHQHRVIMRSQQLPTAQTVRSVSPVAMDPEHAWSVAAPINKPRTDLLAVACREVMALELSPGYVRRLFLKPRPRTPGEPEGHRRTNEQPDSHCNSSGDEPASKSWPQSERNQGKP